LGALLSSAAVYFAGEPKHPDMPWASCTSVSDAYASALGFRTVWFGAEALGRLEKAAYELKRFFEHGLIYDSHYTASSTCKFPSPHCRYEIFKSGLDFSHLPDCAKN